MSEPPWTGRFPRNEIMSLLDEPRRYNLAESTSQDLTLGAIVELAGGLEAVSGLAMGYGSVAGSPRLRAAIAALSGVSPDQVITTQGTAMGLFLLAFELCRPGDEAVIASPCFPAAMNTLIGVGVSPRVVRLSFDQGYRVRAGELAERLSERTTLVSLASPQNPGGVQLDPAEVEELLREMGRRAPRARLFIDETYREATYGAEPSASFASVDPRVITASSLSKAYGGPALRTGWLTVHDPGLNERLRVAKMNTVISGSLLDEALAAVLLENREAILAPRRTWLAEGLRQVEAWVQKERARVAWVKPDAGALCCLRLHPARYDEPAVRRFWSALAAAGLQLADGAWFGETSHVFRVGFGHMPLERLPEALRALTGVLDAVERTPPPS